MDNLRAEDPVAAPGTGTDGFSELVIFHLIYSKGCKLIIHKYFLLRQPIGGFAPSPPLSDLYLALIKYIMIVLETSAAILLRVKPKIGVFNNFRHTLPTRIAIHTGRKQPFKFYCQNIPTRLDWVPQKRLNEYFLRKGPSYLRQNARVKITKTA